MISFECKCGKQYEVPEQYAGKKVRCKKCNNMVRIPGLEEELPVATPVSIESQSVSSSYVQSDEPADPGNNGLPKPLIYTFVALGIFLIGVLLYVFVLRDTWELDNSQHITQMIRDAKQRYDYEEYDIGLKKYDELVSFVGDRELKRENLKADYSTICQSYEGYKEKVRAEKAKLERLKKEAEDLRKLKNLEILGDEFAANGNIKEAVEVYNEALDIINRNRKGGKEFLSIEQKINTVKPELDIQYVIIKKKDASDKEMADKGYIKFRGKWMSPDEYEGEKDRFPAQEIREKMEEQMVRVNLALQTKGIHLTHVIIKVQRGEDLEYEYDIVINAPTAIQYALGDTPIYTYHVNRFLELSPTYTTNGYSHKEIGEFIFLFIEEALEALK